jgi:hypothetical protein
MLVSLRGGGERTAALLALGQKLIVQGTGVVVVGAMVEGVAEVVEGERAGATRIRAVEEGTMGRLVVHVTPRGGEPGGIIDTWGNGA